MPLGLRLGHERERALGAEQHFGVSDDLAHAGRHGFEAVVADADDVDGGGMEQGAGSRESELACTIAEWRGVA